MRYVLIPLVMAAAFAGCARTGGQAGGPDHGQTDAGRQVRVQQSAAGNENVLGEGTVSHLETLAKSIPQVQDAKCVIIGKTAIVGIVVDPTLERSRVNTIKYSVAEAFRKDPAGINAFVTADMGLNERIREVRDDIANGRPFSGFAQELGDIIGRVVPQLPKDIQPMDDHRQDSPKGENFQKNDL